MRWKLVGVSGSLLFYWPETRNTTNGWAIFLQELM